MIFTANRRRPRWITRSIGGEPTGSPSAVARSRVPRSDAGFIPYLIDVDGPAESPQPLGRERPDRSGAFVEIVGRVLDRTVGVIAKDDHRPLGRSELAQGGEQLWIGQIGLRHRRLR